ncbi:germinal-center associated nuclear protein-like isoform X2 [Branchiostoma floridae x Branchiostoma belcheri]
MNTSGSFAQKKKKEALRRLSQGFDRTPRGIGRGGGPDRGGRERGPGARKRWPSDRAPGTGAKRRVSVEGSRVNLFAQQAETIFSGTGRDQSANVFAATSAKSEDATSQSSSQAQGPAALDSSSAAFPTAGTQGFGVFGSPSPSSASKNLGSRFGGQAVFGAASTSTTGGFKFTTTDTKASFGTVEAVNTGGFGAKPAFGAAGVAKPSFSFGTGTDKGAGSPSFGGGSPFRGDTPSFASQTFGQTSGSSSGFPPSSGSANFPSAGASIFGWQDQTGQQSSVFAKQEETKTGAGVFGGKGEDTANQSKDNKGTFLSSAGREGSPSRRPVIDRTSVLKRALTDVGDDATKKVSRRVGVQSSQSGQMKVPQKAAAVGEAVDDPDLEPYQPLARPRLSSSDSQSGAGKRFLTKEEVSTRTTLRCSDIPRTCNDKDFLRRHFSKFGKVVRVHPNPEKKTAVVAFADHQAASDAKRKGRLLKKGTRPITIFWGAGKTSPKGKAATDAGTAASRAEPIASTSGLSSGMRKSAQGAAPKPEAVRSGAAAGSERREREGEKKPTMGITSLGKLRGMAGKTAYEKFQILEQRDRIIRQGSKKQTDLATAKVVVGTCRDMCPEKERYEREFQNRLSVFETLPEDDNRIDHAKAVKEYARSSADKEEPLPHELRPPAVLTLTMDYLVNNVLDTGRDGNWGDWYDFVWNRTRGIRKDITQQLLTDPTAVDLTEKCARFHIHCAHQLCQEPMTVFDPKINNENLTKCLQSLKQFYHDLTVDGRFCPNEGEFRAYELLLNLNQGDILREVQQLRPEVRNSPQMKFALQVFSALNNNNFVRFFKLLWAAPYLPACIMHRYLTQVRTQSIKVMNRAYSITGRTTQFPVEDYMRMMGFEDEDETAIFSEAFGLAVLDGAVGFNRTTFIEGESVPRPRRCAVIVSKRTVSVGEIVQGSPLPPNMVHVPNNSFDAAGFYIGDNQSDVTMDTQLVKEAPVPAVEDPPRTEPPPPYTQPPAPPVAVSPPSPAKPPAPRFSNEAIKEVARDLFLEVIQEFCQNISSHMVGLADIIKGSALYLEDFIQQSVADMAKGVVQEVVNEEKARILRERLAAERAEELRHCQERATEVVCQELVEELLREETVSLATAQAKEVLLQLKKESMERCTVDISSAVQEEVVVECVRDVCQEVVRAAEDLRDQRLAELEQCVQLAQTARIWRRWRTSYAMRKRLRRSMQEFPSTTTQRLPWQKIRAFFRRKRPVANPMSLVKSWEVTSLAIDMRLLQAKVRREKAWAPLDLPALITEQLTTAGADQSKPPATRQQKNLYWKLVLSLPDLDEETPATAQLCNWLQTKLKKGSVPESLGSSLSTDSHRLQTLSLYTAEAGEPGRKICICTKAVHGLLDQESADEVESEHVLLGTTAIILALPPPPGDQDSQETYWLESQLRLVRLLQAKPLHPSLPLLVLPLGWGTDPGEDVREFLDVRGLMEGELVSDCHVVDVSRDVEDEDTCRRLCEGLSWLADRAPLPPCLETEDLRDYVENSLAGEFSSVVYQDSAQRRQAGLPQQTPGPIVCLYNSLVEHLARVAGSNSLQALSWPVAEFVTAGHRTDLLSLEWNSEAQLTLLQERILALRLPPLPYMDVDESWSSVCQYCTDYTLSLPADSKEQTVLLTRLRWLLDRVQTEFEDTCYLDYDVPDCEPTACHVPWTRLVEMWVGHMVQRLDWAGEDGSTLTVHYLPDELSTFTQPTEWRVAVGNTSAQVLGQPHSLVVMTEQSVRRKHLELTRVQTTDTGTPDKTEGSLKLEDRLSPAVSALIRKAQELRKKIAQETVQTKSYEDQLQGYVEDGQYRHQPQGVSPFSSPEDIMVDGTLQMREPLPSPPEPDLLLNLTNQPRKRSLEENMEELRWRIAAGKRDFRLSELRLNSLLDMGDFESKYL